MAIMRAKLMQSHDDCYYRKNHVCENGVFRVKPSTWVKRYCIYGFYFAVPFKSFKRVCIFRRFERPDQIIAFDSPLLYCYRR